MSRKSINIKKNTQDKLKMCKMTDTERYSDVIKRLLDKYEEELLQ